VIRDAISKLADAEAAAPLTGRTPYEGLEHLIGVARGGPADLSVRTGDKLRRLLDGRRRRDFSIYRIGRTGRFAIIPRRPPWPETPQRSWG
jgi:hypothetical protein